MDTVRRLPYVCFPDLPIATGCYPMCFSKRFHFVFQFSTCTPELNMPRTSIIDGQPCSDPQRCSRRHTEQWWFVQGVPVVDETHAFWALPSIFFNPHELLLCLTLLANFHINLQKGLLFSMLEKLHAQREATRCF